MAKKLTSNKAKEILHDKSVHGHPLTDKQRKFFGAIAGGAKPYKSGGWLDKYEAPKAQNGIEGTMGGLTDKGFNYNGAWSGPSMQDGGDLTFLEPTSRKLPKGYLIPYADSSTELATSIGGEDGEPAYLVPSFKYAKRVEDPAAEFRRTGEHLGGPFKTYQEADEWERDVRHPYVEKGQSIPTPLRRWGKDFAMGGSIPGAVGFTYERTQSPAPSNGPYAKKTKASAQNGQEMKFYQEGLDWKPRNISRNGSEISQAQMGTMVTPLDFSKPIGTLEGVSEVMSAPARTATYLLTGKYQDPSQALGIKNPIGAFVADAVLDPVNLLGVGAAGKVGKSTKAAVKASKESGALSKVYKLNPWAFKPNPEAYYRGIGKTGLDDAIESGVLRTPQGSKFGDDLYLSSNLEIAEGFSRNSRPWDLDSKGNVITLPIHKNFDGRRYIAEIPRNKVNAIDKHGRNVLITNDKIPIQDVKLLKQNWLKGYKEVPKPKKKEKGGEIKKDDNGYWNPDNWGEPVEIGSNNITMKGVYEPLVGVSDKGDVQYMEPGKDYKFKGKKVTEYPVKNWLDKYK